MLIPKFEVEADRLLVEKQKQMSLDAMKLSANSQLPVERPFSLKSPLEEETAPTNSPGGEIVEALYFQVTRKRDSITIGFTFALEHSTPQWLAGKREFGVNSAWFT